MALELTLDAIKDLIAAVDGSDVAELSLEHGDWKLAIKKQAPVAPAYVSAPAPVMHAAPQVAAVSAPVAPAAVVSVSEPAAPPKCGLTINAPMVGTFYRSPSPDAAAFCEVGDVVKPGQTVCIIEAMKLMNELEAEFAGRITRFLVENGQPVEYGQPLIELEPA